MDAPSATRRTVIAGAAATAALGIHAPVLATPSHSGRRTMAYATTKGGTRIYYKDWGTGPVVTFSHGWPLSADAWDAQMLFLAGQGFRVIAHDRRGHGRSDQPSDGNDMDGYADDLAVLLDMLDIRGATMVGHSTGGGEVERYIGRYGTARVAKAALISAVPPHLAQSAESAGGADLRVRRAATGSGHRPGRFLPRPGDAVLRVQPAGREGVAGADRAFLGAGDARRDQGPV